MRNALNMQRMSDNVWLGSSQHKETTQPAQKMDSTRDYQQDDYGSNDEYMGHLPFLQSLTELSQLSPMCHGS